MLYVSFLLLSYNMFPHHKPYKTDVLQPLSVEIKAFSYLGVFPFDVFCKCLIDLFILPKTQLLKM